MRLEVLRRELAQGAETIQGLVAGVSAAEARVRPSPEAWSILEVVAHLLDEEREDFRPRLDLVLHRERDVDAHRSRGLGQPHAATATASSGRP